MQISLSDHFGYGRLARFTLPSVVMMIFTSIYGVVDGFFVSNYVGKTPFAALNFIMPFLMILGALGFMFGTGGAALIGKTMGEGQPAKANGLFSMLVYITAASGVAIAALGIAFLRPVAAALGAEGDMLEGCVAYGRIILIALPAYMLQYEFQSLFVTAEKPKLGLAVTVGAGITNMTLDWLFVAVLRWGLEGAAAATALSQAVGGLVPLFYFGRPNASRLRLTRCRFDGRALGKACANGSSELLNNISMSLVSMLYNVRLIQYAGEDGVAAYGVLMYVNMIFLAAFVGYSVGVAPVVSYHYGAQNRAELKSLLQKNMVVTGGCSAGMLALALGLSAPLSYLFTGYDAGLYALTLRGFSIFSFSFLFAGFGIFGSAFFTALNDGLTSALISFLRTLVFQVAAICVLPALWGVDGIWASVVAAEGLAAVTTVLFLAGRRKKFGY